MVLVMQAVRINKGVSTRLRFCFFVHQRQSFLPNPPMVGDGHRGVFPKYISIEHSSMFFSLLLSSQMKEPSVFAACLLTMTVSSDCPFPGKDRRHNLVTLLWAFFAGVFSPRDTTVSRSSTRRSCLISFSMSAASVAGRSAPAASAH